MTKMAGIFEGLIVLIITLALLPVVRSFVTSAQNGSSSSESVLLALVTLFWVLIGVGIAVGLVVHAYKSS